MREHKKEREREREREREERGERRERTESLSTRVFNGQDDKVTFIN
jgi:hypothetical protein